MLTDFLPYFVYVGKYIYRNIGSINMLLIKNAIVTEIVVQTVKCIYI